MSTGQLFRAAIRARTSLGEEIRDLVAQGELVPDDLALQALLDALSAGDASSHGAILDGFPRTAVQSRLLDDALAQLDRRVDLAIVIEVPISEAIARLTSRRVCQAAGHTFHLSERPPRVSGHCDIDGSPLERRADDDPDVVRTRLDRQGAELAGVVAHYEDTGRVARVDGRGGADRVAASVVRVIDAR